MSRSSPDTPRPGESGGGMELRISDAAASPAEASCTIVVVAVLATNGT